VVTINEEMSALDGSVTNDAWGTVIAVDERQATVRMDENGCGRCRESGGCGGNHPGRLFCSTPRTFRIPNAERHSLGERVRISVVDGSVGRSALYAYGFPLLALFAGALSGSALGDEAGAIGGSIAGLFVGWLGLRRAQRRGRRDLRIQPWIRP
jgi:sigma-E factor negative regulatory protein RseC